MTHTSPPPQLTHRGGGQQVHDYSFLHPVWGELFPPGHTFELSRIFRQADEQLVALLNDVRVGRLSQPSLRLLNELKRPVRCVVFVMSVVDCGGDDMMIDMA